MNASPSIRENRFAGSNRRGEVVLLVALLAVAAGALPAQPIAGGIVTQSVSVPDIGGPPQLGVALIDAQENLYLLGGGGLCTLFGGPFSSGCYPLQIAKVDPSGATVFNTVLASFVAITLPGLVVDAAGNVYLLTSPTVPIDIPATGVVAKLSPSGSTLYVTHLPSGLRFPAAIRLDPQGNAYIAGSTEDNHAFVTKLSADGSTILYTVQFAGSGGSWGNPDSARALVVDDAGDVIVTGRTSSADFPVTPGALQTNFAAAPSAFVARLDPGGNVIFCTFLGGSGGASGGSIQTDAAGDIYVAGTAGDGFPTTSGVYQQAYLVPAWSTGTLGFVTRLRPDGSAIDWASYLPAYTQPAQMAVDTNNEVYLAITTGPGLTTTAAAPGPCFGSYLDNALIHLDAQGGLVDATYLGLSYDEAPGSLTLPGDGSVLMTVYGLKGPLVVQVRFGGQGWSAPACLSPDVLNSATLFNGYDAVAPGEFVTLTGFGIGPDTAVSYEPDSQGRAPLSLGGVTVSFNGIPAPVFYAQSRQVNTQVPFEIAGSQLPPQTDGMPVSATLTYNNATFNPQVLRVDHLEAQGIFRLQPGVSTQAAAFNEDGSQNSPSNPATRGSVVTLFGTGYGPLSSPFPTDTLNPTNPAPLYLTGIPWVGWAGGALDVQYAGGAIGQLTGIAQFNVVVPPDAPPGPLSVGPVDSRDSSATIFVK